MYPSSVQSGDCLESLTDTIVAAEKKLASMPGSRHSSCVCGLDEHAAYFQDDATDRVCLRFGQIKNHPGECLQDDAIFSDSQYSFPFAH